MASTPDWLGSPSKRQRTSAPLNRFYPKGGVEVVLTSFATSPLVTIYVGPKQQKFMLHKGLLVEKSPYFEKCLQLNFAEGSNLRVNLEEDHIAGFNHFVIWLYRAVVEPVDGTESQRQAAIEAWVLGDKLCVPEFQNKILDAFRTCHDKWAATAGDLLYICQLGLHESKLGAYLFDQLAVDLVLNRKNQFGSEYPELREGLQLLIEEQPEVAVRLMESLADTSLAKDKQPCHVKGCKYHVHPPGQMTCGH